jgi:putative DNA primase/helicase
MSTELDAANALMDAAAAQDKKTPRSRRKPPREPSQNAVYPLGNITALGRYVVIYGTDDIYDLALNISMKPGALRLAIGKDGYREWEGNPQKLVIQPSQLVFDPTKTCSADCINLFSVLPMKPVKGDCADLLELLIYLIGNVGGPAEGKDKRTQEITTFVLSWLAYPLQNPGAKMSTAILLHGPQGVGKNLFFEAYARIFGEYASVIGQAQLESRYNDWASRKLLVIGDEIVASNELTHHKNALKSYVTSDTVQIERKFLATRIEKNHANFVFLSNENKPLALEKDDRRHCVIYCPPKREDDLYTRVRLSLDNGGIEALYAFLMAYDLTGFHAHTLPPVTEAKEDLVELGLRPAERFTKEWLKKDLGLPLNPCSTAQLYKAFQSYCRSTGERIPPNQANFTSTVIRYAGTKLDRPKASPSPHQEGTTITLLAPAGTGPVPGVTRFDWASECVSVFEVSLNRYTRNFSEGDPQ